MHSVYYGSWFEVIVMGPRIATRKNDTAIMTTSPPYVQDPLGERGFLHDSPSLSVDNF